MSLIVALQMGFKYIIYRKYVLGFPILVVLTYLPRQINVLGMWVGLRILRMVYSMTILNSPIFVYIGMVVLL